MINPHPTSEDEERERRRRGTEQRLAFDRMVFRAIADGVIVQAADGMVLTTNPAATRILGLSREELVEQRGNPDREMPRRPDGTSCTEDELPASIALRTGEPQLGVVLAVERPDGTEVWLEINARPLRRARGEAPFAVVSTLRDVTKRHHAEEKLRTAEHRQRLVLEHAVGGYVIIDDAGEVIDASTSLESWRQAHLRADRRVGFNDLHPEDRDRARSVVRQAQRDPGVPHRAELRGVNDDGMTAWIEMTATDRHDDPAVGGIIINYTDITERKLAELALTHQSLHDPLTGLPNRALLSDRLETALSRAERDGTGVAVVFLDVDHFKLVNESLGHGVGDHLLQEVAARLLAGTEATDTIARFAGDCFVVVSEALGDDDLLARADSLSGLASGVYSVSGVERMVTLSAGIVMSQPGDTATGLLRDADAAMHRAKERGQARTEVFAASLRGRASQRLDLSTALRHALERDEFRVVYQPIVSLESDHPVGCEALVRWEHPTRGPVMPEEFIPFAEQSGLIVPIGKYVLHEAARQMCEWHQRAPGASDLWVSVNVSARQIAEDDCWRLADEVLRATSLPPSALHLEVTESTLMEDMGVSIESLHLLQELGVKIAIDDFGTGYSSLSYLKRLPIDTLKIDRSFVDGLGTDPHDTSIARAITSLADALELELIAEGVETETQLTELRKLGCDLGQGFLWCTPLGPGEFAGYLEARAALL
jgi:diguanylate cyclase (GGDEF)-like protein/PAS domain S-box-containing protein